MQAMPKKGDVVAERYVIEDVAGVGGFATVFQAWDQREQRRVGLKVMLPEAMTDPTAYRRIAREARLMSALRHPNTVQIYEQGIWGDAERGLPFLAMELLRGQTLSQRLKERGVRPGAEVVHTLIEVLKSLEEAHRLGLVHRDIKPDNLFWCDPAPGEPARLKVLDFGLARALEGDWSDETRERLTQDNHVAGTVSYIAPELVFQTHPVGPSIDQYALGCVAYALLVGVPPFKGDSVLLTAMMHLEEEMPSLPPSAPAGLEAVLRRSMAKNPAERFEGVAQMREALEALGPMPRLDLRDSLIAALALPFLDEPSESYLLHPLTPSQEEAQDEARAQEAPSAPQGAAQGGWFSKIKRLFGGGRGA
jgi:serine/threonine protein kinase